jgi:hypothetical protein
MNRKMAAILGFALTLIAKQTFAQATITGEKDNHEPLTLTIATVANGQDRYGAISLARGNWKAESISWVNPGGSDSLTAVLAGKAFHSSRSWSATVLAGPLFSYSRHRFDEVVVNTSVEFHGERIRAGFNTYWGIPIKRTGFYFSSHSQTITGVARLPAWLGFSFLEKHESAGLERLWAGPQFTRSKGHVSLSAYPYWDFTRHTADLRLSAAYTVAVR